MFESQKFYYIVNSPLHSIHHTILFIHPLEALTSSSLLLHTIFYNFGAQSLFVLRM